MKTNRIIVVLGAVALTGCAAGVRDELPEGETFATVGATDGESDSGQIPSEDTDGGSSAGSTAGASAGTTAGDTDGAGSTGPDKEPMCGDAILDAGESCDLDTFPDDLSCQALGYDDGVLVCADNCLGYDASGCYVCGNDEVEDAEDCDGSVNSGVTCESLGFEGGTVTCGSDCFFDTSDCSTCSDGVVNGFEVCDGNDLDGATCASLGLGGGTLACTTGCTYDFTGCDIAGAEFGSDVGYTGYSLTPTSLPCDDISGTGVATNQSDDDNDTVAIGFSFPFYGTAQTQANINSNGTLRFGDTTYLTYTNSCLPTATTPNTNTLYVMWNDLNPSLGSGNVYYQTLGNAGDQRFVVQWDTANFGGNTGDLMRFQVMLFEATGQIQVCYPDTVNGGNGNDSGALSTVGIQRDSMTGFEFSCNTASVTNGTMLMYVPN
jgi:hypothetical protein